MSEFNDGLSLHERLKKEQDELRVALSPLITQAEPSAPEPAPKNERCWTQVADEYAYTVQYSPKDRLFVARVAEFPSLAAHGSDMHSALAHISEVTQWVLRDMEKDGEAWPVPMCRREEVES